MNILTGLPEINSLTSEQENALATSGSIDDRNTLVLSAMREGFAYSKKCCRSVLLDDDIFSSVYEALVKAASAFKPNQIRFFAYAKPYLRGALSSVWKGRDVVKRAHHVSIAYELQGSDASEPEEYTGGLTEILINKKRKSNLPSSEPDFDSIQLNEEYELLRLYLKSRLTDKEQTVIALRYKSGLNFSRIGQLLDTSRADAQSTHARAISKLRDAVRQKLTL